MSASLDGASGGNTRGPVGFFSRLRSESGQGVVEFAMVVPFIALVALVCILFGKALYEYIQVTHAANEGARLAAVNAPPSSGSTLATFLHDEFALPSGATVVICYPTGKRTVGEPVEVDVYANASWVPAFSLGQIRAAATMRIEQDTTGNAHLDATKSFNTTTKRCST